MSAVFGTASSPGCGRTPRRLNDSVTPRAYARVVRRLVVILCALTLTAGPAAAAATLPGFRSPSGNIRCLLLAGSPASLLCTIAHASYTKQLQDQCMARASLDWHGFMLVGSRKGTPTCSGGILHTQPPHYVNLPYGRSWHRASFTCTSRVTGVTCRSAAGHGLFLSRASWRAW